MFTNMSAWVFRHRLSKVCMKQRRFWAFSVILPAAQAGISIIMISAQKQKTWRATEAPSTNVCFNVTTNQQEAVRRTPRPGRKRYYPAHTLPQLQTAKELCWEHHRRGVTQGRHSCKYMSLRTQHGRLWESKEAECYYLQENVAHQPNDHATLLTFMQILQRRKLN